MAQKSKSFWLGVRPHHKLHQAETNCRAAEIRTTIPDAVFPNPGVIPANPNVIPAQAGIQRSGETSNFQASEFPPSQESR